jgi:hypothetical protein
MGRADAGGQCCGDKLCERAAQYASVPSQKFALIVRGLIGQCAAASPGSSSEPSRLDIPLATALRGSLASCLLFVAAVVLLFEEWFWELCAMSRFVAVAMRCIDFLAVFCRRSHITATEDHMSAGCVDFGRMVVGRLSPVPPTSL